MEIQIQPLAAGKQTGPFLLVSEMLFLAYSLFFFLLSILILVPCRASYLHSDMQLTSIYPVMGLLVSASTSLCAPQVGANTLNEGGVRV